jgi:hypothetical protein
VGLAAGPAKAGYRPQRDRAGVDVAGPGRAVNAAYSPPATSTAAAALLAALVPAVGDAGGELAVGLGEGLVPLGEGVGEGVGDGLVGDVLGDGLGGVLELGPPRGLPEARAPGLQLGWAPWLGRAVGPPDPPGTTEGPPAGP